jgi:hypothetical protein
MPPAPDTHRSLHSRATRRLHSHFVRLGQEARFVGSALPHWRGEARDVELDAFGSWHEVEVVGASELRTRSLGGLHAVAAELGTITQAVGSVQAQMRRYSPTAEHRPSDLSAVLVRGSNHRSAERQS